MAYSSSTDLLLKLLIDRQISASPAVIDTSIRAHSAIAIALPISRSLLILFFGRPLDPKFHIIIELEILRIGAERGTYQIVNQDVTMERRKEIRLANLEAPAS